MNVCLTHFTFLENTGKEATDFKEKEIDDCD